MARFSQAFLQGLLQPTYQQGLFEAARGVGQTPGIMRMQRQQQAQQERQRQMAGLEAAGAAATEKAQAQRQEVIRRRAMQVAQAKGDTAALQALEVKAMDPAEYLKAQATGQQAKPVNVPAGGALVSPAGEVLYERPFKPEAAEAPKVSFVKTKDDKQVLVFEGTDLVNTIEVEGDTDEEVAARESVISSTSNTLQTVREAKQTLTRSGYGMDPGGISGAISSLIPGTPAHELMTSTYVTIAGREALDEINRMKAEAAKFGSRGTGLGQVTQIEFAALQGNLAKLNTGLTVERQMALLEKIEQKLESTRRIASGENPIDVIDFNDPLYIEAGYVKEGGEVYYFAPGGKEFIYDRNKEAFVPVGG
jgi:hypothetical protein